MLVLLKEQLSFSSDKRRLNSLKRYWQVPVLVGGKKGPSGLRDKEKAFEEPFDVHLQKWFEHRLLTVRNTWGKKHKGNRNKTTKNYSWRRPPASIQYMSIAIWYMFPFLLKNLGGGNKSHRSPSFAMLIHQSVFRTLASGNLITSDLGWQEAGLTDNTNSFIMGEQPSCAAVDPLSLILWLLLQESPSAKHRGGLGHMKLSSEIIHLSTAG